jgi:uncharacterized membrane protein HdeD (DUF308 family)
MTSDATAPVSGHRPSSWLTIEGVLAVALGVLALVLPFAAGLAAALVVAWVLLLSGVVGLVGLFAGRGEAHPFWSLISTLAALVAGGFMLWFPILGAVSLVIVIAAYLIVDGVAIVLLSLDHRRRGDRGWGWLMAVAVLDLIFGVLVLMFGPVFAPTVVGIVVGIDLVLGGLALLSLGWARRRAE